MAYAKLFASALTSDGRWAGYRITERGTIVGAIPGSFESKVACDDNAKRFLGK